MNIYQILCLIIIIHHKDIISSKERHQNMKCFEERHQNMKRGRGAEEAAAAEEARDRRTGGAGVEEEAHPRREGQRVIGC